MKTKLTEKEIKRIAKQQIKETVFGSFEVDATFNGEYSNFSFKKGFFSKKEVSNLKEIFELEGFLNKKYFDSRKHLIVRIEKKNKLIGFISLNKSFGRALYDESIELDHSIEYAEEDLEKIFSAVSIEAVFLFPEFRGQCLGYMAAVNFGSKVAKLYEKMHSLLGVNPKEPEYFIVCSDYITDGGMMFVETFFSSLKETLEENITEGDIGKFETILDAGF